MALDQDALNKLRINRTPDPINHDSPKRRGWLIAVGVAVIVAAALWWWFGNAPLKVQVTTVRGTQTQGAGAVLDASGYVIARRQATVSAKVTGKVEEVLVEEGMQVKAGQILARLDSSTSVRELALSQQQLAATQAQRAQLEVRLAEAARNARRAQQLRDQKMISEADLDSANSLAADLQAQLNALSAQINVAKASLRLQEQAMDDLTVRAPFTGVVVSKDAQPGEMVSPISAGGGFTRTGIATLVDMESREIEVDVNEAFIHRVRAGQRAEATLDAYADWMIPAKVINIVPTADRQKATVKVRIGFDQLDPRILPDMGVKVRFLDDESPNQNARNVLAAPSSSVLSEEGRHYVWRVKDERLEKLAVSTGNTQGEMMQLFSGVNEGDTLVLKPDDTLRDGARVAVQP